MPTFSGKKPCLLSFLELCKLYSFSVGQFFSWGFPVGFGKGSLSVQYACQHFREKKSGLCGLYELAETVCVRVL